jgi:hypothetical protein
VRAGADREPRGQAGLGHFEEVLSPRGGHHGIPAKLFREDGIGTLYHRPSAGKYRGSDDFARRFRHHARHLRSETG